MDIDGATVLVTGANGFVGGRIASHLADRGAHVRALVRRPGEAGILDRPGVDEVEGDFTDPDDARNAVDGVDGVVHCAATAGDDLEAVRRVNRDGTRVIARAALDEEVEAFVHISTAAVYDRDRGDVVDEDAALVADEGSPYAVTKAEAEREVQAALAIGLPATILRPPAILGWSPTSTWGQRVPERIRSGEMPGRPEDTPYAWVHVDDLAVATELALTDPHARGRAYNVVGGHTTWGRYVRDVAAWFEDAPDPELEGAADWTGTISTERIEDELGWRPQRGYDEGMAEAADRWTGGG